MGLLNEKVALITGAGGGIGREHAVAFAKEGAKVVVNDVGGDRHGSGAGQSMADSVVEAIRQAGGEAAAHYGDISSEEGAASAVDAALTQFGKLDILVNNAGILRDKTLVKMTTDMFDAVIRVHLRGTFLCTQLAAKHMIERGEGGRIINTSSVSGLMGNFGQANYAAAKAGIYGFTMTCAMELKRKGITVNALAPVAKTRMTDDLPLMDGDAGAAMGPEHVATAAVFLASAAASDVTGAILAVEGSKMYTYRMLRPDGVLPENGKAWTVAEIAERWSDITRSA